MNDSDINTSPEESTVSQAGRGRAAESSAVESSAARERNESRRWWIKLFVQPLLLLIAGVALVAGLGLAQKLGWISAGSGGPHTVSAAQESTRYICPMMCTPPQTEPGRCPVCAMELVPATSGGGSSDSRSVQIDSAARRIANIRTASVKSVPLNRTILAIGELSYDESSLKTISAYVDGRLEHLVADYTGVVVQRGDPLAIVYSPRLYTSQVELLLVKKSRHHDNPSATSQRSSQLNRDLYQSAKRRLIEMGMTEAQIEQIERAGEANSRMQLYAPISGTVIKKYVVEGQYVKEGQPIYSLADLSTVWLMLELFPEDAATIRYGQKVEAEVQSLPGRTFVGRVAFIDPNIDPKKRTVGVRVAIANERGLLRVGDFAKATIQAPFYGTAGSEGKIYDPDLAGKWISPRHPHVVESSPGKCRVCGVDLVPAATFGFAQHPSAVYESLVVPRNAVLMAGSHSVVYVEAQPGHFEIRQVVLGPSSGNQIVILEGVSEGEQVAYSGNFLIDSEMQLAGNPSLIDPTKAIPAIKFEFKKEDLPPIGTLQMIAAEIVPSPIVPSLTNRSSSDRDEEKDIEEAIAQLSPNDRVLAETQRICPVTDMRLGSMGSPVKVDVDGRTVFLCCEGCRERLLAEPVKYLAKISREVLK